MTVYVVENKRVREECDTQDEAAQKAAIHAAGTLLRTYVYLKYGGRKEEKFSIVPAGYKCEESS